MRSDVEFLHVLWQDILTKRDQQPAPSLLHSDLSLSFRVVRDLFGRRVDRLLIDSREEYNAIKGIRAAVLPRTNLTHPFYDKEESLFDYLG